MRLYLSSYRIGNHPDKLVEMVGANKRTAIIMNAIDWGTQSERAERLDREVGALGGLGFDCMELDLRGFFGRQEALRAELTAYGLVWIRGGNVFVLKSAMEQSGFDTSIGGFLDKDQLVYAGYSAAACIAAPTLRGIELVDDVSLVPAGHEFNWNGLGLITYSIAPHYKSDHPESEAIEAVVEYFEKNKMPFKTLRDGEVLVVEGTTESILS